MSKLTPMMQQYKEIKDKHKDSILFFRLGDFYEMFFDDAIISSKVLEIALTGRNCGQNEKAPMCGVPFHAAESYIQKLIENGYKVAICEQVEDPALAKGIVKRDVIRVITPGTVTNSKSLEDKKNNYLCCLYTKNNTAGISYVDVTTGQFYTTDINENIETLIIDELAKIQPTEIICNEELLNNENLTALLSTKFHTYINKYEDYMYELNNSIDVIKKQFNIASVDGFGLKERNGAIIASGALISYLNDTQKISLNHINNITYYSNSNYMLMDISTRRNLELTETMRNKNKQGSLLWVLDNTKTAMGGRLLKKWIEEPLLQKNIIEKRLDSVEYLVNNIFLLDDVRTLLKDIYDMERLISKIVYGNCNARDLISLKKSIGVIPSMKRMLYDTDNKYLQELESSLDDLKDVHALIENAIVQDPPLSTKDGGMIREEYSKELAQIKMAALEGKQWISNLQENERKRTSIKSLKVGYNKVFGYYIEITKSNIKFAPDNYIRKQTLSNAERYITPELKEMESKILGAEDKYIKLELEIFNSIKDSIKNNIKRIQKSAGIISQLDAICSLSHIAYRNNYIKPTINTEGIIDIKNGKHPVVEKVLKDDMFVPNDTYLNNDDSRMIIITGPNMAGKSTYMRQVALISLMAQVGSFVPADEANIAIVDRIFTRVGASDNLAEGQSTFMVEMSEVANILNNATKNSLIILDEIGRGTSTYDGLSIAWAVVEYISNNNLLGAKTLFATHYHELTELEGKLNGIKNYKILVKEQNDSIIFLRKIDRGEADKSYGIEVAKLAGIPDSVINRAKNILFDLEKRDLNNEAAATICSQIEKKKIETGSSSKQVEQISFFNNKGENIIKKLNSIDIAKTTPLDALNILYSLVEESKKL
ncbi:DNA mismatch repair protein MutS [Abyssisolibacter fermentans]|uniref:DNA mismatch repair protein MutS n=1 Tax=Abyssisolibacter fermentans TaxID=1766203 RepID=UPI000B02B667|nr:DNA mismatch repair protein MutS [Abyssisolibacter fermentans]